jgi:hypothetical protein
MNLLSGLDTAGVQPEIMMSHKPPMFRNGHCGKKPDTGVLAGNPGFTSFHAVADTEMLVAELL